MFLAGLACNTRVLRADTGTQIDPVELFGSSEWEHVVALWLTHCANSRKTYHAWAGVITLYCIAQMKRTAAYGIARTGDDLIVGNKNSQHVPFYGRQYFHLKTAGTNETQKNEKI
jgi:hypothetical protein